MSADTSALHARHPREGAGRRAYDPEMLLALLIYAYCTKQRSSRQIEWLCEVDVAYRVICANHVPDHTTIARFRQDFADDVVRLFADVLEMCAAAGLVNVGVVAVDGTKFAADASLRANRTRANIEAEIRTMLTEAEQVDAAEDDEFGDRRGDELPDELADRRRRLVRLREARDELERRRRARQAETDRVRGAYRQRGVNVESVTVVAVAQFPRCSTRLRKHKPTWTGNWPDSPGAWPTTRHDARRRVGDHRGRPPTALTIAAVTRIPART